MASTPRIAWTLIALAACCLTHAPGLRAQTTEADQEAVLLAAIRSMAEYRDVPLDQVVIRFPAVGRPHETGPDRTPLNERQPVVARARLDTLAAQYGFHISTVREQWLPGKLPSDVALSGGTVVMRVHHSVQEVHGDSAMVIMFASTDWLEECRGVAESVRMDFARQDGVWVLAKLRPLLGESSEW